jgi:hypothetical protein
MIIERLHRRPPSERRAPGGHVFCCLATSSPISLRACSIETAARTASNEWISLVCVCVCVLRVSWPVGPRSPLDRVAA